jgi:tetratricopeptide (TPR) repeat protein
MSSSNERLHMMLKMQESQPDDSFLAYAISLEYRALGDHHKAASMLAALIKKDPDYLPSYYQLGKIQEEHGQLADAIETYKAGKKLARRTNDMKTLGELNEALMMLDVYED